MNIDVISKGVASRRLANKVCIVTSAAGGIGEATAVRRETEHAISSRRRRPV
jgi:NAD(P)-dependent dehydrogenase (short-subunit alcohol dehydrogenase family)